MFGKIAIPLMSISIHLATAVIDSLLILMRHMQDDDSRAEPFNEAIVRKNLSVLVSDHHFGLIYLAREKETPAAYLDFSLAYRGKGARVDELFAAAGRGGKCLP